MFRLIKWLIPAIAAAALFLAFSPTPARADDTAATGSVTGKVVDASGAGVANVPVKLIKPLRREKGTATAPAAGGKGAKLTPVAEGTTGADGTFTLANVPAGEYLVIAGGKGLGRGHAKVSVTTGTASTPVTLTLQAAKAGAGKKAPAAAAPADAK